MAKKQTMNIFEAHVEKALLLLSIAVCLWAIFTWFLSPPGAKINGQNLSASDALAAAADKAQDIIQDIDKPASSPPPPPPAPVENIFNIPPFIANNIPRIAPPAGGNIKPIEDRLYLVPTIMALDDIKIDISQVVAAIPQQSKNTTGNAPNAPLTQAVLEKDWDFVTVSAQFPIARLYESFRKDFVENAEKPLEQPEPVLALVELQRRYLKPDGSWSDYESVPRLDNDPLKNTEISLEQINQLSPKAFQVEISQRHNYHTQLELLQPRPYDTVGQEPWLSPPEKEQAEKAQATAPGSSTGSRKPYNKLGSAAIGSSSFRSSSRYSSTSVRRSSYTTQDQKPPEFLQPKIYVWAFDGNLKPGRIYAYRFRLGFFNPIADKDWFTDKQKDLKYQRVLWSKFAEPALVEAPRRTFFFPNKHAGKKIDDASISVDVYHKQMGIWYSKTFRVAAGSLIGKVTEETLTAASSSADTDRTTPGRTESLLVDYRTGVELIDTIENSVHFNLKPNLPPREIVCTDIIYQDMDGSIKSLGTDKITWPDIIYDKKKELDSKIREQKKKKSTTADSG